MFPFSANTGSRSLLRFVNRFYDEDGSEALPRMTRFGVFSTASSTSFSFST